MSDNRLWNINTGNLECKLFLRFRFIREIFLEVSPPGWSRSQVCPHQTITSIIISQVVWKCEREPFTGYLKQSGNFKWTKMSAWQRDLFIKWKLVGVFRTSKKLSSRDGLSARKERMWNRTFLNNTQMPRSPNKVPHWWKYNRWPGVEGATSLLCCVVIFICPHVYSDSNSQIFSPQVCWVHCEFWTFLFNIISFVYFTIELRVV